MSNKGSIRECALLEQRRDDSPCCHGQRRPSPNSCTVPKKAQPYFPAASTAELPREISISTSRRENRQVAANDGIRAGGPVQLRPGAPAGISHESHLRRPIIGLAARSAHACRMLMTKYIARTWEGGREDRKKRSGLIHFASMTASKAGSLLVLFHMTYGPCIVMSDRDREATGGQRENERIVGFARHQALPTQWWSWLQDRRIRKPNQDCQG
ncbi:hypothetical protein BO70DRAFT_357073 [Aspergillus heteromorphus CBS 117.55]|uniref:Uncharacterized protein n=1 Tax=Aspergillus heteromorphus CBS 117.55 TaxID=1448321 RepID=A0A317UR58_9EURO|nr:uncharacterized protein BO70DRAFT_357073 [Aspergillus heteromorphus CBS 117.55]PWY63879.1 hypothetical protein BO70DRAFT_357073 [Aspergillus heteromorphus CBS 117.55]